jgi:hypothetical protein
MKTKPILLGIAALLSTAVHGQSNDAARLQGCWQRDEVVTTRLNGDTSRGKVEAQCRDWITAEKVTSACLDSLGLVRGTNSWSYEMPAPDKITLRMHLTSATGGVTMMPPTSEGVQFEKERLGRTKAYPDMKATDRNPNPGVRYDTYYTRVSADENHCIPRAEQVEAMDAWTFWRGRELAHSFRRYLHDIELILKFKEKEIGDLLQTDMPKAERARVILELRRLIDHAPAKGMTNWADQAASLEKTWADKNLCGNQKETLFLSSPAVRQWADDTVRETIALQRLTPHLAAAMFLYPDEAKKMMEDASPGSREAEKRFEIGALVRAGPLGLFSLPRIVVAKLADYPDMGKMIDPETDFKVLRDLGRRNIEFVEKNNLEHTSILDCPRQLAASFPQPDVANIDASARAFKDGLETLKGRVWLAANLRNGPSESLCRNIENVINMESLKASQGNPHRILNFKGKPITDEGFLISTAMSAYTYGCSVPRDVMRARQVLDQGAVAMENNKLKGKSEHEAWCRLARWYRHGIGGPKNLKMAEAWEKRVKDVVTPTGCPSVTPIDPSDPWRVIE